MSEKILIALGGNALIKPHQAGTIDEQLANLAAGLDGIVELVERGHQLVITHGNGPQVGNILLRVEAARGQAYDLPLDVCVAQSQGELGYLIQQSLQNALLRRGLKRPVVSVISQVIVSEDELRWQKPTKPIGPFYTEGQAQLLKKQGYSMVQDAGRGYRRVVRSPAPLAIVEQDVIKMLFEQGVIVIAVGGGGIPVTMNANGYLRGVAAVVDKDLASATLANAIGADKIMDLTSVEKVKLNYGKPNERDLDRLTTSEAKRYLADGQFPRGSMGPKIEASIQFLEHGGQRVIISTLEKLIEAFDGTTGTHVYPDPI
ncbi:MAG: carbamate kinase [Acidobacteriota bacterium]|nr:carbamate kinase [Blastocatellia bacterium]MDW8238485.1 carbamate kinase [Acidobacteriota bacterium]